MAYATYAELLQYLPQADTTGENAAALEAVLDRATSIVDGYLGFSYGDYPASATAKTIHNYGVADFALPPHEAGSVTAVAFNGTAVTTYQIIEDDRGNEVLLGTADTGWAYTTYPLWTRGRYVVTAKWGYGPVPDRVKQVVLELAVNIWAAKEAARFSAVVGVEGGGAVGYEQAFTPQQRLILDKEIARFQQWSV
jgi:hypothetical protein